MPAPLTTLPAFEDGNFSTPQLISRKLIEAPFKKNGDVTTTPYISTYLVDLAKFSATVSGTVDPANAGFYLITESRPQLVQGVQGHLATFTRLYSNIPLVQTKSVPVSLTRPDGSTVGSPAALVAGGTVANSVVYTLDLVTTYPAMYAYLGYYIARGLNAIFGAVIPGCSSANNGADTRVLVPGGHGLTGAESCVVWNAGISAFSYVAAAQSAVVDATHFDILGHNYGGSINSTFGKYFRAYTPGLGFVKGQEVTTFYLPGVTGGIATPDDIPVPAPLTNDATLLTAVIANAGGFQHYDILARDYWQDSAIYFQTVRKIDVTTL